ncbi:helix-turn-helix domain-containing protein [Variovorax sp. S2]|uniref:helix-turn-helix domain-containing protein n=1 Tax=Variovorax sp. S12S4 TaxID=3029170 RepID=UPI00215C6473|nr:helix-turn-helix transcriptional regulator [Variovorax sp. S12S4]MCR8956961.1 helix-turn-helix domain-containing protein [Variovorax sp. S12S4]
MKNASRRATPPPAPIAGTLPNEVTLALGKNLKKLRLAAGKTQVALAYDAEVERSRISKLEGGHINPSVMTLATLCYSLGTTLPVLFEGIVATNAPTSEGGLLRRKNQAVLNKPARSAAKRSLRS